LPRLLFVLNRRLCYTYIRFKKLGRRFWGKFLPQGNIGRDIRGVYRSRRHRGFCRAAGLARLPENNSVIFGRAGGVIS
jgi:hypothetical protein